MANKQYISIIRLLDYCGIASDTEFNLPRVKKQLQAEFGITPNGFIEIDGYSYSRQDVFEEIEHPDFQERLIFHKQLWESHAMLELLEKNTINFYTIDEAFKPFIQNEAFDVFFSPYFVGPFSYLSRSFLSNRRLNEMGRLLCFDDFVQPPEREEAFRPLRLFLDEEMKTLRNVSSENYEMLKPKFDHWITTEWHLFLNNLPHEFYDKKVDITTRLVNIGVSVQKANRHDCKRMSDQLILLQDIPDQLSTTISSNHAVYNSAGKSITINWRGGFGLMWAVIILIKLISSNGCSDSSNKYKFDPTDIRYTIPDSTLKKLSDSFLHPH